jgi:hypothetical protein
MDMLAHFRRSFAYDDWANREVLSGLKAAGSPPARPLQLVSEILSAERLWLERLERRQATYPVWPALSIGKCEAEVTDLPWLWHKYLGGIEPVQLSQRESTTPTVRESPGPIRLRTSSRT